MVCPSKTFHSRSLADEAGKNLGFRVMEFKIRTCLRLSSWKLLGTVPHLCHLLLQGGSKPSTSSQGKNIIFLQSNCITRAFKSKLKWLLCIQDTEILYAKRGRWSFPLRNEVPRIPMKIVQSNSKMTTQWLFTAGLKGCTCTSDSLVIAWPERKPCYFQTQLIEV